MNDKKPLNTLWDPEQSNWGITLNLESGNIHDPVIADFVDHDGKRISIDNLEKIKDFLRQHPIYKKYHELELHNNHNTLSEYPRAFESGYLMSQIIIIVGYLVISGVDILTYWRLTQFSPAKASELTIEKYQEEQHKILTTWLIYTLLTGLGISGINVVASRQKHNKESEEKEYKYINEMLARLDKVPGEIKIKERAIYKISQLLKANGFSDLENKNSPLNKKLKKLRPRQLYLRPRDNEVKILAKKFSIWVSDTASWVARRTSPIPQKLIGQTESVKDFLLGFLDSMNDLNIYEDIDGTLIGNYSLYADTIVDLLKIKIYELSAKELIKMPNFELSMLQTNRPVKLVDLFNYLADALPVPGQPYPIIMLAGDFIKILRSKEKIWVIKEILEILLKAQMTANNSNINEINKFKLSFLELLNINLDRHNSSQISKIKENLKHMSFGVENKFINLIRALSNERPPIVELDETIQKMLVILEDFHLFSNFAHDKIKTFDYTAFNPIFKREVIKPNLPNPSEVESSIGSTNIIP